MHNLQQPQQLLQEHDEKQVIVTAGKSSKLKGAILFSRINYIADK